MDMPYSSVSMVYGSFAGRGFRVMIEKVWSILRSVDPLASASRWQAGITKRHLYSVARPNLLWCIGEKNDFSILYMVP